MECKKCGIDLSDGEYRTVAQWFFCPACFQKLMEKAEVKPEAGVAAPMPTGPALEKQTCMVCERILEKGEGHELLGLVFCLSCYENLVKRPSITPRAGTEERDVGKQPMEKQAVEQVPVDLNRTVICYGCSKNIPAVGSKLFNGNSYCPDCYYGLPEIEALKPRPFSAQVSEKPNTSEMKHDAAEKAEDVLRCQACQRRVLQDNPKTVEGFEICLACLTTDPSAALDIARSRHRKMLEK